MAVELENVVPLGRSLKEYRLMFGLRDEDLDKKILGVADGIASFNAEMTELGKTVVSVDPIYNFDGREIKEQFYKIIDSVVDQLRNTQEDYIWEFFKSPDEYREYRIQTLDKFIGDYDLGKRERRYIIGDLPSLDIENSSFDLALSAHLLFFYSDQLSYEFHLASVKEILRKANEVRFFPLLDIKSMNRSVHLDPIIHELESEGLSVELREVDFEMQRGGNMMLRIVKEQ